MLTMMPSVVRVLVCDDSGVVRSVLERLLHTDPSLRVVAKAANGLQAIEAVQAGGIDVVILDIEMPVMDGLAALPRLLKADRAVKVLIASAMTTKGGAISLEALRLGAADFIAKPTAMSNIATDEGFRTGLVAAVLGLGRQCHAARARRGVTQEAAEQSDPTTVLRLRQPPRQPPAVFAIGSSTGGPAALRVLFQALQDRVTVPIVLTQHMPASFTSQLAEHIHRLGGVTCAEAVHGEPLRAGHVHLAPGNRHLTVVARDGGMSIALTNDPPENFCRPSVDPMLRSLSVACPGRVLALFLTGMGQDGLLGAERVVADGGCVIAQDEATSIVWGMPGAVARAGLCHAVLPLTDLAPKVLRFVGRTGA
jgi:two-component system chemotaxis response regulator CheB